MTIGHVLNLVVALAPVVAFLAALWLMDSFRLVRPRAVVAALAYGAIAAGVSSIINEWMLRHVAPGVVTGYVAPVVEETIKAGLIVAMIATSRIGFLVDAAV